MSNLRGRANLVDLLGSSLSDGGHAIAHAPKLLRRVLEEDAWRDFETKLGTRVQPRSFEEFVTTPPLQGLGASIDLVRRIVADDPVTANMLDEALQNLAHIHTDVDDVNVRPTGNSRDQAMRRLRKDNPALHAEVLAGKLTAHAAMVKAGHRRRTVNVPIDEPERVAATLAKHLTPDQFAALRKLIDDLDDDRQPR